MVHITVNVFQTLLVSPIAIETITLHEPHMSARLQRIYHAPIRLFSFFCRINVEEGNSVSQLAQF